MTVNRKPTGTASSIPAGLVSGAMTAAGITLILSAVVARMIDKQLLSWDNMGYGVMGILLAASWLGAIITAGKVKRQRFLMCVLTGVLYYGILLAVTALFFGGQYSSVGETGLLIFCGSVLAAFTGISRKSKRKPRIHNR